MTTRMVRWAGILGLSTLAVAAGRAEAQQTYRWQISNGVSVAGATTNWSAACGTALAGATARVTTMDANAFGCASTTITDSYSDQTGYHPFLTLVRAPAYPSATFVTGVSFLARVTGSSATSRVADFELGYVQAGAFVGFGNPAELTYSTTTTTTRTVSLSAQSGTVPANAALALRIRKQYGGETLTLALGSGATPAGSGTLTVVEKTVVVSAAANPAPSTVGKNGAAPLDAFTLTVSGGPATVSGVSFAGLTGAASVATMFVSEEPDCEADDVYGSLAAPGASGTIATPGLIAATGTTTVYLCMTASGTAGTVTGYASGVLAPGFAVSGTSSAGTSVTVLPPSISISAAANPGPASLAELGVAALDAFTLDVTGGPAAISSVSFAGLGGTAAVASVFVNDSPACTGTTHGTRVAPGPSGTILTPSLTVPSGPTTLYLCMAASATAGTVSGFASTVAADGFAVTGTSSAGTVVTVAQTPPSVAVAAATNPPAASVALDVAAPIDAFTLDVRGGPAAISSVSFALGGTTAAAGNAFVSGDASCAGAAYGSLASPGGAGTVQTAGLSVPSGTTTLYLCVTGSTTAGSVTGSVTGVTAPGFPVSGASSAGTTITVYVPAVAVGAAANPGAASVTVGNVAALDAFSLAVTGGAATIRSVSFAVTGSASMASVFVNDAPTCNGATYGTCPLPGASGAIATAGLTVPAGTATLYLCMAASNVGGSATGAVTGVTANCASPGSSTAGTTVTIGGTTPSAGPTVAILNPGRGAVVSASGTARVQVRVFDANSLRAVTAVQLSTDGGATYPISLSPNAKHTTASGKASVYEGTIANLPPGTYALRARAVNGAPGVGTTVSSPIAITSIAGSGDGNLLVRDNSSQLCADCHQLAQHSSESLGAANGAWATTCLDCHTSHGTRNIALVRERIVTPSSGTKSVGFVKKTGDSGAPGLTGAPSPTPVASFANSDNSGPCQVCHTKTTGSGARWRNTGNADLGHWAAAGGQTASCTASSCHSHARGFAAPESKGKEGCRGCHGATADAMAGSAPGVTPAVAPKPSRHSLVGSTDGYDDPAGGGSWAGTTALSDIPPAQRSCVNMCHQDHVHNAPGAIGQHAPNVSSDASSQAARAVTRSAVADPESPDFRTVTGPAGVNAATDFDETKAKGGLCVSCHEKPIGPGKGAIAKAAYGAGAHDYTANTAGGTTWTWEYRMHDGSTFARNCTKCHASREEGRTPSSGGAIASVHGSDDPNLLAGSSNPAALGDSVDAFVCYNCHGSATAPAAGSGGNRSGKDVRTALAKPYYHPVNDSAAHDAAAEATATYANGRFGGANRHASCADCHDPHAAGNTLLAAPTSPVPATRNQLPSGSPLTGALGVRFGPGAGTGKAYPALWTVPTATSFSDTPVAATREYEICFKCHSSFAFGATPPAVGPGTAGPATDLALEFSPNNRSGHPVVASLQGYGGSTAPRALTAAQLLPPWNAAANATSQTGIGYQTMTCGDCHDGDANAPAVRGPHGSAVRFMLTGTNRQWPTQADGVTLWTLSNRTQGLGTPNGLFCYNCHPSTALHAPHSEGGHTDIPCQCVMCHIVVPHGSKMSRLIVSKSAPAPYRHANIQIERFQKASSLSGYGASNSCRAQCYPDHDGFNGGETF